MKTSELVKKLKQGGYTLERHGGNHDIYVSREDGKRVTVPRHSAKEIPTGTANAILKAAGLK